LRGEIVLMFQNCFEQRAQVSLEYLLLLAAFFGALALILPAISFSVNEFYSSNDTILAKNVSEQIKEQINLFSFLGDGSKKVFDFFPSQKIVLYSNNQSIFVSSSKKEFEIIFPNKQNFSRKEFNSKFFIQIEKKGSEIVFSAFE